MNTIRIMRDDDLDHDQRRVDQHGIVSSGTVDGPDYGRPTGAAYLANRMILAKSSGSREAPPTSPPSISGMAIRSATLPGFMLPP